MSDPRERAIERYMAEAGASREGAEEYVAYVESLFGPIEDDADEDDAATAAAAE